jgi:uncharacterized membrane protein YccC
MSESNEQEQVTSQDPLNYAPRWLREKPEPRTQPSGEPRVEREIKAEPPGRAVSRTGTLDRQLENAVYESLRRSLDPEVMPEPPAANRETERKAMFGFASRLAVAVGVSAVVALFFVIMVPATRQPDAGSSLASTIETFTAAVARTNQAEDASKPAPALAEFKGLLPSSAEAGAQPANPQPQQSEQLLQQFMVWREKANPNEPPQ